QTGCLACAGGAAGVGVAVAGIRLLRTLAVSLPRRDLGPTIAFPRLDEITIDGSVLVFTVAVSMATGVLFGLIPAIRQSRPHSWRGAPPRPFPAPPAFVLFLSPGAL